MHSLIHPSWPLPPGVAACSSTRHGGFSQAPYESLNLGTHVGDDAATVQRNRESLVASAGLPQMPHWLTQVHGTRVLRLDGKAPTDLRADAVYSNQPGQVCAVMTADCLPVLFSSLAGNEIAAAHAGWRGLCDGVLEKTVAEFAAEPDQISVWLGPAIGPHQFEVGAEVREAFMAVDTAASMAFTPCGDKYLADIYLLARQRLQAVGITAIYGGDRCTVSEASHFFSYRRDGITGRLASLIWLI